MENARKISSVYGYVMESIEKLLKQGTVPWHKPWQGAEDADANLYRVLKEDGQPYSGGNVWTTYTSRLLNGFTEPYWVTLRQAKELKGKVKASELKNYTLSLWYKMPKREVKEGEEIEEETQWRRPWLQYHRIYNVNQTEGLAHLLPQRNIEKTEPFQAHNSSQALMDKYFSKAGAPALFHDGGNANYYMPKLDSIHLTKPETFEAPEYYYTTAFHEMAHSTGHASRLNRKGVAELHHFGDENYSKEELCAEICSCLLASSLQLASVATVGNSAAYINGWLRKMRSEPTIFIRAAEQASKAANFILGKAGARMKYERGKA